MRQASTTVPYLPSVIIEGTEPEVHSLPPPELLPSLGYLSTFQWQLLESPAVAIFGYSCKSRISHPRLSLNIKACRLERCLPWSLPWMRRCWWSL